MTAWTPDKILDAIDAFYRKEGRLPTRKDWTNKNGLPSYLTVCRYFGGDGEAKKAAVDRRFAQ